MDILVEDFDPFRGTEPYDLECLINKMTSQVDYNILMDKVFNFRQASSMLAMDCMETLPAAIGRYRGYAEGPVPDIYRAPAGALQISRSRFPKSFLPNQRMKIFQCMREMRLKETPMRKGGTGSLTEEARTP